jgi:hypothetical protein
MSEKTSASETNPIKKRGHENGRSRLKICSRALSWRLCVCSISSLIVRGVDGLQDSRGGTCTIRDPPKLWVSIVLRRHAVLRDVTCELEVDGTPLAAPNESASTLTMLDGC